jgi:redox-sensitive bicupin YhaK (pirin superfamily)
MPAAPTENPLLLPRIPRPDPATSTFRPVVQVVTAKTTLEGAGLQVRRPFPGIDQRQVDPFLLLDHLGTVEYAPGEAKGAPWHSHRGFEAVTYIIDGAVEHKDSTGGGGLITDGAAQWMTTGAGILHDEMPPEALVRLIAGDLAGHSGPGATWTPIIYAPVTISPDARLEVPWRPDFNALAYVLASAGAVGPEGQPLHESQLAVFGRGDVVVVHANRQQESASPNLEMLLLGASHSASLSSSMDRSS